jgi:hypothetical protein
LLTGLLLTLISTGWLVRSFAGEPAKGLEEWKFDVLHLKDGQTISGLILEENKTKIQIQRIERVLGEPTRVLGSETIQRTAIKQIERLSDEERAVLAARVKALQTQKKTEKLRIENLELESIPWGTGSAKGLRYTSDHFVLTSNTPEEIVRRAAVRLEQLYDAYARLLPPRRAAAKPTKIVLLQSVAEYQALVKKQGHNLFNPAFYDPARNQIACATDFGRLGEELKAVRLQEEKLAKQIEELKKRFKGNLPKGIRQQIARDQQELGRVKAANDKVFEAAARRLFQTLYHEAFHAYLDNFVYPAKDHRVPLWLNEGLAQLFETALIEANELRIGSPDRIRLARAKMLLEKGTLVPLADLFQAGPKQFQVVHASDQQVSDRYYVTSWALAFYLVCDQKILSNPKKLDQYIKAQKEGASALAAAQELVGRPLPQLQRDFREFVRKLK